jgi:hypothetical protein
MENNGKKPENGFMQGWGFILLIVAGVPALLVAIKMIFNL